MELKITSDGSHTLFVRELNETYHSIHGAIQEAKHVFINAGLKSKQHLANINLLEIGFGTGLNTLLTLLEEHQPPIFYVALEKFPLNQTIVNQLNYIQQLKLAPLQQKLFHHIHSCEWQKTQTITTTFQLLKINDAIENFETNTLFDIIYFDAFAPEKQPELWEESVFEKIFNLMHPHGILVTYCAKGVVKRTLKQVGFTIETLPGPPGKREMIRAVKNLKVAF